MRRLIPLILGPVLVLLVLAQLLLPGIAAHRLRDQLAQHGAVLRVEVHAFPAIELLWHQADRVVIRMASYRSGSGLLAASLDRAGDVGTLDASTGQLTAGLLTLRDARLHQQDGLLSGSARVREADLRAAVPFLVGVHPVASGGGQLILRGTATLLGVSATVDAAVTAAGGEIQVAPQVPFGGLATVTVFSDPHLQFQSLSAAPAPDGFTVSAGARLG